MNPSTKIHAKTQGKARGNSWDKARGKAWGAFLVLFWITLCAGAWLVRGNLANGSVCSAVLTLAVLFQVRISGRLGFEVSAWTEGENSEKEGFYFCGSVFEKTDPPAEKLMEHALSPERMLYRLGGVALVGLLYGLGLHELPGAQFQFSHVLVLLCASVIVFATSPGHLISALMLHLLGISACCLLGNGPIGDFRSASVWSWVTWAAFAFLVFVTLHLSRLLEFEISDPQAEYLGRENKLREIGLSSAALLTWLGALVLISDFVIPERNLKPQASSVPEHVLKLNRDLGRRLDGAVEKVKTKIQQVGNSQAPAQLPKINSKELAKNAGTVLDRVQMSQEQAQKILTLLDNPKIDLHALSQLPELKQTQIQWANALQRQVPDSQGRIEVTQEAWDSLQKLLKDAEKLAESSSEIADGESQGPERLAPKLSEKEWARLLEELAKNPLGAEKPGPDGKPLDLISEGKSSSQQLLTEAQVQAIGQVAPSGALGQLELKSQLGPNAQVKSTVPSKKSGHAEKTGQAEKTGHSEKTGQAKESALARESGLTKESGLAKESGLVKQSRQAEKVRQAETVLRGSSKPRSATEALKESSAGKNDQLDEISVTRSETDGSKEVSKKVAPHPLIPERWLEHSVQLIRWALIGVGAILILVFLGKVFGRKVAPESLDASDGAELDPEDRSRLKQEWSALCRRRMSVQEEVIEKYQFFLKMMDALGHGRPEGLPPLEYCGLLEPFFPRLQASFLGVTDGFCDLFYGQQNLAEQQVEGFRRDLTRIVQYFI